MLPARYGWRAPNRPRLVFFVFGMPRSGTTLLAQCLNAHTKIVVPHETDFIVPMAFLFDRIIDEQVGREVIHRVIVESEAFWVSLGEYLSPDDLREVIWSCDYSPGSMLKAIYDKLAKSAGVDLAGDKSPNDLNFLRILAKTGIVQSEQKVIHVVRDLRDVMTSLKKAAWVSGLDLYFPRYWCSNNLYLNGIYQDTPSNYTLIRYEDFVAEPDRVMQDICAFLGVPYQPEMLNPDKRHRRYEDQVEHANLYNKISPNSIGKYRHFLKPEIIKKYEKEAEEAMTVFGYINTKR